MGINLVSANRVVIFDSSWNPANDLQAIHRVYRYGQEKNVFVYRLLSSGSMEEKIYKKQVTKQALAARVVDAQMPDNLFNSDEIGELFTFQEDGESSVDKAMILLDSGVKDDVLIKLVQSNVNLFVSIEDQGSLLEDKPEAHLTADEELAAQDEYEKEIQPIQLTQPIQPILIGVEDQERKNQLNVSTALANSAYIEQLATSIELRDMQIRGHDPLAAFTALSSTTSSWNLPKILQEGNKSNQDLGVNKIRDERGNLPSVQLLQNIDPSLAYQQRVKTLQRNLLEPQLAQQQQVQQQYLQHQRQQQVQQPTQEQGKFNEASHVGNLTGENLDNFSFYSDYFKTLGGKERAQRIIQIQAQKKLDDERRLLQQQQQSETFQRLEQERKQKKEELPPILQSLQVDEEVVQQQQTQPIPVIDWKDNIPNQRGSVLSHIVRHFAPANLPKNLLHRRSQEIELNYLISCETLEQYIDPSRLTQYLAECEL